MPSVPTYDASISNKGAEFAELIGPGRAVIEFGSGSSVKTPLLLSAIAPSAYVPLDIAGDFLRASSAALAEKFPGLPVLPVEADFMRRVELPAEVADLPKLGFFPGSTIGNMIARTATDLLRSMRETLGEGALLLIGMDLVKDEDVLLAAYDDAAGVTARFNCNLLERINRELDADIPVASFAHEARWNDPFARIEMHLVAREDVSFTVSGQRFAMRAVESIHTENSHKFSRRSGNVLLLAGGLLIGTVMGEAGTAPIAPVFMAPFKGVLALFLLELGLVAGGRLGDLRHYGLRIIGFALLAPPLLAVGGALTGVMLGLSTGGVAIMATLAASASYIAAPTAMRMAVPEANAALSITAALGLTFPFNIVLGVPLYLELARWLQNLFA